MKKRISWSLLGVFLVVSLLVCSILVMAPSPKEALAADPVTIEVYNPTGAFQITQTFSPRLSDLNGKTVCEVGNAAWQVDRTFPLITSLLQKQFPAVKVIGHDQLPTLLIQQDIAGLEDAIKAKGCQAVIVGNAG